MAHELPAKLRVTMALLGCNSRKELCARFREVNPRTQFDLERSHKWLQGRAKPRTAQVYEDWTRLLGMQRPAAWLTACTLDAFLDEVCGLFAADCQDLRQRAGLLDRPPAASGAPEGAAVHYLCGAYVAYSNSWSLYFPGQLARSSVVVHPGKGAHFPVEYRLSLPTGPVELRGQLGMVGHVLHVELRDARGGAPVHITAFLPGRPASVMCGIMSGATVMSPDPEPSATRIALLRVPPAPAAEPGRSNCFLPASAGALAADLAAWGIAPAELEAAAAGLLAFLNGRDRPGMNQVRSADQARLAGLFASAAAQAAPEGTRLAGSSMASRAGAHRVGSSTRH
jgi:hypothetical protein